VVSFTKVTCNYDKTPHPSINPPGSVFDQSHYMPPGLPLRQSMLSFQGLPLSVCVCLSYPTVKNPFLPFRIKERPNKKESSPLRQLPFPLSLIPSLSTTECRNPDCSNPQVLSPPSIASSTAPEGLEADPTSLPSHSFIFLTPKTS
jgi:hypothetical protein